MPESSERKKFFVVWSPQGGPPVARFPTFKAARSSAIRLSLKFPEQDFFVLESCWGQIGKPPDVTEVVGPDSPTPDPTSDPEVTP